MLIGTEALDEDIRGISYVEWQKFASSNETEHLLLETKMERMNLNLVMLFEAMKHQSAIHYRLPYLGSIPEASCPSWKDKQREPGRHIEDPEAIEDAFLMEADEAYLQKNATEQESPFGNASTMVQDFLNKYSSDRSLSILTTDIRLPLARMTAYGHHFLRHQTWKIKWLSELRDSPQNVSDRS